MRELVCEGRSGGLYIIHPYPSSQSQSQYSNLYSSTLEERQFSIYLDGFSPYLHFISFLRFAFSASQMTIFSFEEVNLIFFATHKIVFLSLSCFICPFVPFLYLPFTTSILTHRSFARWMVVMSSASQTSIIWKQIIIRRKKGSSVKFVEFFRLC